MRQFWLGAGIFCAALAAPAYAADAVDTSCDGAMDIAARVEIDGLLPTLSDGALREQHAGGWYRYTPTADGFAVVRAHGLSEEALIEIWSGCPADPAAARLTVGYGMDAPNASAGVIMKPGETLLIRIYEPSGKPAQFKFDVDPIEVETGGGPAGPDIQLFEGVGADNFGQVGGVIGFSISSYTCNVGGQSLAWINYGTPVLAMNAFRLNGGRLTQIGQGFCKSACCVANGDGCNLSCDGFGEGLLPGCRDVYGSGFNAIQDRLAPRSVVNPWTGTVGSFPQTTGNAIFRRLQVRQTDLTLANSQFFTEGVYVCTDEVESTGTSMNNATYERVTFSGGNLVRQGSPSVGVPAIKAWRAHGLGPNQVDTRVVDFIVNVPGEGRFHGAEKVTDLGNGRWLYDYAIYNLNSDRAAGSFSVPVAGNVTNIGFKDVDYHSGEPYSNTDWVVTQTAGRLTWSSPQTFAQNANTNALRWGTMYNFWFETTQPPVPGMADLGLFKPGTVNSLPIALRVPLPAIAGDMNCDGVVNFDDIEGFVTALVSEGAYQTVYPNCRWLNADIAGDGTVNFDDIDGFIECLVSAACG